MDDGLYSDENREKEVLSVPGFILCILKCIYNFQVTTNIYNLILGKVYCDHHGTMHIRGNREYSCTLKFKEPSILDRNPHQVS